MEQGTEGGGAHIYDLDKEREARDPLVEEKRKLNDATQNVGNVLFHQRVELTKRLGEISDTLSRLQDVQSKLDSGVTVLWSEVYPDEVKNTVVALEGTMPYAQGGGTTKEPDGTTAKMVDLEEVGRPYKAPTVRFRERIQNDIRDLKQQYREVQLEMARVTGETRLNRFEKGLASE